MLQKLNRIVFYTMRRSWFQLNNALNITWLGIEKKSLQNESEVSNINRIIHTICSRSADDVFVKHKKVEANKFICDKGIYSTRKYKKSIPDSRRHTEYQFRLDENLSLLSISMYLEYVLSKILSVFTVVATLKLKNDKIKWETKELMKSIVIEGLYWAQHSTNNQIIYRILSSFPLKNKYHPVFTL